jgi:hypothetical protein
MNSWGCHEFLHKYYGKGIISNLNKSFGWSIVPMGIGFFKQNL